MKTNAIYILFTKENNIEKHLLLQALKEIKDKTNVVIFRTLLELNNYLSFKNNVLPQVLFLDPKMGFLYINEIKKTDLFKNITIAIYSNIKSLKEMEDIFVIGANVYIKKPTDISFLKHILSKIISLNTKYQTLGFDKQNFMLSI